MDGKLKKGLIFMGLAVVLTPLSLLLKAISAQAVFAGIIFAMVLELIGLVFVLLSVISKRKKQRL